MKMPWFGLVATVCALVWLPVASSSSAPGGAVHAEARDRRRCLPKPATGSRTTCSSTPTFRSPRAGQRRAAERLLAQAREASLRWRNVRAAAASGFDTHLAKRAPGDDAVGYLHAEHRRNSADRRDLAPGRPESLIYATEPGRTPVLVGVMFSVRRGVLGPTPAGPIARWHSHLVCARGNKRGLTPPASGCPAGTKETQGSEMLHLWFTNDLRSAFAVHAPVPELCRDGLLTPKACRSGANRREM